MAGRWQPASLLNGDVPVTDAATASVAADDRYRVRLLVNSLMAYALALLVSITLHEFGHATAALAMGARPLVYPFSVDPGVDTDAQHLITALAGPAVSLLVGVLALTLPSPRRGFARLALMWFGLICVQITAGYLMTAPFPNAGDISSAIRYAHAPYWIAYPLFVLGLGGMLLLGWLATARLVGVADPADDLQSQVRRAGLLAWTAGTAIVLVLSIGAFDFSAIGVLEVFGVLTAGIFLTLVRFYLSRMPAYPPTGPLPLGWPVAGAVLVVLLAVARLAILAPGLEL
jgi:hypothetical protein